MHPIRPMARIFINTFRSSTTISVAFGKKNWVYPTMSWVRDDEEKCIQSERTNNVSINEITLSVEARMGTSAQHQSLDAVLLI